MPRALWKGAISFGLVNIPVRLQRATVASRGVRLHQVHDVDGAPIVEKRFCSLEDVEVPWEHVARAYEDVQLGKEELAALDDHEAHTIEIERFVDLADIDPIYFHTTYHVVPEAASTKAHSLLVAAMQRAGKIAIARIVLRTRQHVAVLRPFGQGLALATMYYADEISSAALPSSRAVDERELAMAGQLVEAMAGPFEPELYRDEHTERVRALIAGKAKGEQSASPARAKAAAAVLDLTEALAASITRTRGEASRPKTRARRRPAGSGARGHATH